jgi:hypothetical protein
MFVLRWIIFASWPVLTLAAQDQIQPDLEGLRYPALARAARIQGTVQFVIEAGRAQLALGHPFLVGAAKANLGKWATAPVSDKSLTVTYDFRLTDVARDDIEVEEPIGDAFDRFFLRLFHRPVKRRIATYVCHAPREHTAVRSSADENGRPTVEIEIASEGPCGIDTSVSYALARR